MKPLNAVQHLKTTLFRFPFSGALAALGYAAALCFGSPVVRAAHAQSIAVNATGSASTTIPPGAKLTIPVIIDLANAAGLNIASLQAGISWGTSALAFDSIRVAPATGWTSFVPNTAGAGGGSISFSASRGTALPSSGTVANAFFTASATLAGTRVLVTPTAAANASLQTVLSALRPRALDVCVATPGAYGDVTGDGNVNIIDAQQVALFSVGSAVLNPLFVSARGDVTADGSVNIVDAQQIALFSVGSPTAPLINSQAPLAAPAASLALTPNTLQNLFVNASVQLLATPTASVGDLTGCAPTVWGTSNSAVAVVNSSGFVTALGAGSAMITATSGTVSSQVSITGQAPVTVAPADSGEPFYVAGSGVTLLMQDNMESYTTATAAGATPQGTLMRMAPLPSPVTDGYPVDTLALGAAVIAGRNGSAKALRLKYNGVYQSAANWVSLNTVAPPALSTNYFQYWARVTVASSFVGVDLGVKWFEAWHPTGNTRVQWSLHNHLPWTGGSTTRTYWQVYDQGYSAQQGTQPVGPYFNENISDGQWHRFSYEYRPNTSAGSRDGVARMWIDGIKVIDISASAVGVTPPGGAKTWCEVDDIDALAVANGILYVRFGSTQTTTTPAWTYDIDDFVWWWK